MKGAQKTELPTLRELTDDAVTALGQLRDRLRVKMHLANVETRDVWRGVMAELETVEAQVRAFEREVHASGDEARVRAHLALLEARDRWGAFADVLARLVRSVKSTTKQAREKWDWAQVDAHLARLDSQDFVIERSKQVRSRARASQEKLEMEAREVIGELAAAWSHLRERLG